MHQQEPDPFDMAVEGAKKGYQTGKSTAEGVVKFSQVAWQLLTYAFYLHAIQVYVFIHRRVGLRCNSLITLVLGLIYLAILTSVAIPVASALPGFDHVSTSDDSIDLTAYILGIAIFIAATAQMGYSRQKRQAGAPIHGMDMGDPFPGLDQLNPAVVVLLIEPCAIYILGVILFTINPFLGAWLGTAAVSMFVTAARAYHDREKKLDGQMDAQFYGDKMQQAMQQRQAQQGSHGPAVVQPAPAGPLPMQPAIAPNAAQQPRQNPKPAPQQHQRQHKHPPQAKPQPQHRRNYDPKKYRVPK